MQRMRSHDAEDSSIYIRDWWRRAASSHGHHVGTVIDWNDVMSQSLDSPYSGNSAQLYLPIEVLDVMGQALETAGKPAVVPHLSETSTEHSQFSGEPS
jgi:hypothetical protein